jgi:nucleoside-diphosphate-sugar epimerase
MTSKPRPNILVTGGGGFLGGAIVKKLVEKGADVCSFSRNFYPQLEALGVKQIQGDISDGPAADGACRSIDIVYHVAAKAGVWGDFDDYFKTNVTGTRNVIAACIRQGVPTLVYTSSPSVVFNGKDMANVDESVPYPSRYRAHYPATKALAEQSVLKSAGDRLRVIILRPHLIWGPRDNHLVPRIIARAKKLVRVGDGQNLVDTTYIDNAADAHILAAEKLLEHPELSKKIYFISQGEPMRLWDMINAILNAGGLNPVKRSMPAKMAWLIGAVLEYGYKALHLKGEPQMTRFVAEELAASHWFNISAARKDLEYVPKISTAEGLKRLQKWLESPNGPSSPNP